MLLVAEDGAGRLFTTPAARDGVIVFGRDGRVHSIVGVKGTGSVQFGRITRLLRGPKSSVIAYDAIQRRTIVLPPAAGKNESFGTPYEPAYFRADASFISAMHVPTPAHAGYPLHLVSRTGEIVRSFGADPPEYRPDLPLWMTRLAAPGPNGTTWAVAPGRYVLERWDPGTGKRIARVPVQTDWFIQSGRSPQDERVRPTPVVQGLWEADGVVWMLSRTADAKWKPPERANIERVRGAREYDETYDWMLEAIDANDGTVVASRRFDGVLSARSPEPLVASRPPEGGRIDVWRVELVRKVEENQ